MAGKMNVADTTAEENQTPAERRAAMTRAKRLKRVYQIEMEICGKCGGAVKVIASIEIPTVISKIRAHLDINAAPPAPGLLPQCRAPPQAGLFEEPHRSNIRLL